MKNVHPLKTEKRRQKRVTNPIATRCVFCIEAEHPAGRNHDFALVFPDICQKHQDQITERRRDADINPSFERNRIRRIALALKSVATFLKMLAEAMWRWATILEDESRGDDE